MPAARSSVTPGGRLVAVKVSASPSASSAMSWVCSTAPSATVWSPTGSRTGAALVARATMATVCWSRLPSESVTTKVTLCVPASAAVGVQVKTALP